MTQQTNWVNSITKIQTELKYLDKKIKVFQSRKKALKKELKKMEA